MRYFLRLFPLAVLIFISSTRCHAEIIRSFEVDVRLHQNATLDITETIAMDFEKTPRHGIFRNIPFIRQRVAMPKTLDIKLQSVTNEKNAPRTFIQNRKNGELTVRIGDAKTFVTGLQTYRLHYVVKGAIRFFDGAPEVYWNATGNKWPFPIQKVTVRFYAPRNAPLSSLKFRSFRGALGSKTSAQNVVEKDCLRFSTTKLRETQGLTFVVRLPKDALKR